MKELQGLIEDAKKNNVEGKYVAEAEKLTGQMSGNIESRHILSMFVDHYPEREWPEEDEADAKKGKPDKNKKPKKKKKIVQPTYEEWAEDIDNVRAKVDKMRKLVADKVNLKLDDAFCAEVDVQLKRMTKDINYRQELINIEREEAELRALKKKAKKK